MKILPLILLIVCLSISAFSQTVIQDLSSLYNDTVGSTNSTYIGFAERKLTGNGWKYGALWLYNINEYVAAGGGIAREIGGAAPASYNLSVGIQLSMPIAPLKLFGVTNEFAHPFVATFVGTPFSGDNSGNLMNASRTGVDFRIYTWQLGGNPLLLSAGGYYGNETGTGYYAGNWVGAYARISWGAITAPSVSDNRKANAWTTIALTEQP